MENKDLYFFSETKDTVGEGGTSISKIQHLVVAPPCAIGQNSMKLMVR